MKRFMPAFESLGLFLFSFLPLLIGFTRFPKLVGDEGIYVSQAWWLVGFGQLGPYTYWYDHFPLGWFLIGLWQKLTGGPFLLGLAEFSGRLMMILLTSLISLWLYRITLHLTRRRFIALIAVTLFALSPMSLIFHRQVLLENLAVLWLVASLWCLLIKEAKGYWALLGGWFLALGILTKESLLFLIPAYLVGIFLLNRRQPHRLFLLFFAAITILGVLAAFPLLAILKNEFWSPRPADVSLLATIAHQIGRGNQLPFWQTSSEFNRKFTTWLFIDPVLMMMGIGSLLVNLATTWKKPTLLVLHLLTLSFFLFLLRGGLLLDFYIIPLIPLLALEICLFIFQLLPLLHGIYQRLFPLVFTLGLLIFYASLNQKAFTLDVTANQLAAYRYLEQHAQADDTIITDNYFFLNLRFNPDGSARFPNTHWYTKAETDPYIRQEKLSQNPATINWLLADDMIKDELDHRQLPFIFQAKANSEIAADFPLPSTTALNSLYQQLPYVLEPVTLYQQRDDGAAFIASLSPAQQLGQRLLTSPRGLVLTDEEKLLLHHQQLAGVVITKQNIGQIDQLNQLLVDITQTNTNPLPLIIAVSFEGGSDAPIPWFNAMSPALLKSSTEASEMAHIRGQQLKNAGFNAILGPLFEIKSPALNDDLTKLIPPNPDFSVDIAETYQQEGLIPFVNWLPLGDLNADHHYPSYLLPFETMVKDNRLPLGVQVNALDKNTLDLLRSASAPSIPLLYLNPAASPPSIAWMNQLAEAGIDLVYIPESTIAAKLVQTASNDPNSAPAVKNALLKLNTLRKALPAPVLTHP